MKTKTGILTATAIATIISMGGLYDTATAATVGYWRFEDGAFLTDSSGNGNTLTVSPTGAVTQQTLPVIGKASTFSNPIPLTGAPNGSVVEVTTSAAGNKPGFFAADSSSFSGISTNGAITIEAFLNPGPFPTGSSGSDPDSIHLASQYNGTGDLRGWNFQITPRTDQLAFRYSSDGAAGTVKSFTVDKVAVPALDFSVNTDYYVAVSYAVSSKTVTFYWQDLTNGGLLQSTTLTDLAAPGTIFDSTGEMSVGYRPDSTKRMVAGSFIDELRISDTVLAPEQLLIPEPTSLALLGLGGLALLRRSRK